MLTRMQTVGAAVVAFVLLAVIGTTLVLAQSGGDAPFDTGAVDLDTIREDAVRNLFDSDGRLVNPKQQLAVIAKEHEGGFGGYYFDETDKSTVYVYMKDVTKTAAAEAAFRAAYSGDRQVSRVIAVQGGYSFDQLVGWFNALDRALIENGIPPAKASIREVENRIRIGLFDASQIDGVRRIMKKLGIPDGAVAISENHSRLLAGKDSVRAKWRPLVGGIQHETGWYTNTCTIGFVTERDDKAGRQQRSSTPVAIQSFCPT